MGGGKRGFYWAGLVVFTAILFVLILLSVERLLSVLHPDTPMQGTFFPRYTIDGKPSIAPGYFTTHPFLPVALKPNFKHTVMDSAYYPVSWMVTLDKYGYRNEKENRNYDLAIVGDSVAFGFGVNDDQTIARLLGGTRNVYNLAIPGAGPEMYMKMIDMFRERAMVNTVAVLFYEGNDYANLEVSCWNELRQCLPPSKGKIQRADISDLPENQSVEGLLPSIEGFRRLEYFFRRMVDRVLRKGRDMDAPDVRKMLSHISQPAITDIENYLSYERKLTGNAPLVGGYLHRLADASCVTGAERRELNAIAAAEEKGNYDEVVARLDTVTISLIGRECMPIDDSLESLTTKVYHQGAFYFREISAIKQGYWGNVYNYISFLQMLGRRYGLPIKIEADKIIAMIREMKDIEGLRRETLFLRRMLKFDENICEVPSGCDRMNIFTAYLASLKAQGVSVAVFLMPAEYQLKNFPHRGPDWRSGCERMGEKGITCVDITPQIYSYYASRKGPALYLDGAHLTPRGNSFVARIIEQDLYPPSAQ